MPGAVTTDALTARADHATWNYGSRVSKRWRYVCVTTPKVGCSTVKAALHILEGKGPLEGWWTVHADDDEMSMSRFGAKAVAGMLNDDKVLKFCLVRNPYDRIFSAWKSKILRRMDTQFGEFRDRIRDAYAYPSGTDAAPRPTVAFGDFVRYVVNHPEDEWSRNGHWARQVDMLWWGVIPYDVVGRFETFTDDFVAILQRLGATDDALDIATRKINATPAFPMSAAFDTELAGIVYDYYRADFEAFGYDKDSWQRYESLNPEG